MVAVTETEFEALKAVARGMHKAVSATPSISMTFVEKLAGLLDAGQSERRDLTTITTAEAKWQAARPISLDDALASSSAEQPDKLVSFIEAAETKLYEIKTGAPFGGAYDFARAEYPGLDIVQRNCTAARQTLTGRARGTHVG